MENARRCCFSGFSFATYHWRARQIIHLRKREQLCEQQFVYLANEGIKENEITFQSLLTALQKQVALSIKILQKIKPETLLETRYVGRKKIASTQLGLLFHATEHTMRHTGQLMVTLKMIIAENKTRI